VLEDESVLIYRIVAKLLISVDILASSYLNLYKAKILKCGCNLFLRWINLCTSSLSVVPEFSESKN
jgi:hypothetical protein